MNKFNRIDFQLVVENIGIDLTTITEFITRLYSFIILVLQVKDG